MKLVDANVFIYAVGEPHRYKESCIRLMTKFEAGEEAANIDAELLQEILFYFWRRGRLDLGIEVFDRLLICFSEAFAVGPREVLRARDILNGYPQLEPRDAVHAAVVLLNGLEGIISADRGFDAIPGIKRFDPLDLARGS